ncbi:ImmA/IrrE family metallo-endopeptidase [Streptococcus mitis]
MTKQNFTLCHELGHFLLNRNFRRTSFRGNNFSWCNNELLL